MKNSPRIIALFAIGAVITFNSCKKETSTTSPNTTNEFHVSVVENRLVFKTIEDYEKIVNEPKLEIQAQFLATVASFKDFTSFSERQKFTSSSKNADLELDTLIKDDYLKAILNSDLAVQIGNHIFRINPLTEKVYALPVANSNQYNDLVNEDTTNADILKFSTSDDVLEMIVNGETEFSSGKMDGLFCKEGTIGQRSDLAPILLTGNGYVGLFYIKYGIYFNVQINVDYVIRDNNKAILGSPISFHVYGLYKGRCQSSQIKDYIYTAYLETTSNTVIYSVKKKNIYSSVRPLNSINMNCVASQKIGATLYQTRVLNIKD